MKYLFKASLILLLIFLLGGNKITAQTTPELRIYHLDEEQFELYVRDTLFAGGGEISNINYKGKIDARDAFESGIDVGFDRGLILTNGYVYSTTQINGGDNKSGAQTNPERDSLDSYENLNDEDMDWLMGVISLENKPDTVVDVSVLEFKFKPFYDSFTLNYVFASEEYKYEEVGGGGGGGGGGRAEDIDLTGEDKSDFMAIFVKKFPSQQDNDMIASMIGNDFGPPYPSKVPVSVRWINHETNDYVYISNKGLSFIYDGLTEVLPVDLYQAQVEACETYWIKIAVADYPNGIEVPGQNFTLSHLLNSAVFLEAGTFKSGIGMEWEVAGANDNPDFEIDEIVEGGCANMVISLAKNVETLDTTWIRFKITGADPNTDYTITPEPVNDSLMFLAPGQLEGTYIVSANFDDIDESGIETWRFRYQENPCDIPSSGGIGGGNQGYSGEIIINVHDYEEIPSATKSYGPTPNSIYYCGGEVELTVTDLVEGGIPPYSYNWSQLSTGQLGSGETFGITISDSPDVVVCNVSDRCSSQPGYQPTKDTVIVYSQLLATPSPDFQLCENLVWDITIENTNVDEDFTVEWFFDGTLVGTDKIYTVTWDEYGSLIQSQDSIKFDYVVTDYCGNTTSGEVWAFLDPVVAISGPDIICLGEPITLSCTPGKSYQWYNNSVAPGNEIPGADEISYTYTPFSAGMVTKCVEIINACDQPASTCFTFQVSELVVDIELNGGDYFNVCPDEYFTLEELNGYSDWEWRWTDYGMPQVAFGQEVNIRITEPGPHLVNVSAYNEYGCYDERDFTINVFPYPALQLSKEYDSVCSGYPNQLNANTAVETDDFFWTSDPPDPSLTGQETLPNPVVEPLVQTTYSCNITDINGCRDSVSIDVYIREPISGAIMAEPFETCSGDEAEISFIGTVRPGASYNWTFEGGDPPVSTDETATVTWDTPGSKTITVEIEEPGCYEYFEMEMNVNLNPSPFMTAQNAQGCRPLEVSFFDQSTDLEGPVYEWNFGDGTTSNERNPVHTYEEPGTYDVRLRVTNSTGCNATTLFPDMVEVYPQPEAGISAEPLAATIDNPVISFFEQIEGEYNSIEWDFGDGETSQEDNPVHRYSAPGSYDVIMYTENSYGCWDADTVNVGILLELKIYIPTAFSPNGDGLNDCFSISGTTGDVVNNFRIRVFDRWGNLIFNNLIDSPDCIWDGRDQEGEPLPVGTYLYRITGNDMRGGRQNFEGSVTIYK